MIGLAKVAAGPGNLELTERPEPEPAAGEVRIDVGACGVCGTDLHIEADEYPSIPPVTLGHEVFGVVGETGPGVDPVWVGARVVCEPARVTCGSCRSCREGRPNLCPQRGSIGAQYDGGFAPRMTIGESNLYRVPDRLPDAAAALSEPLAAVCQAMTGPPTVAPGDRVVVVGPGPIGILAAQVAAAYGGDVTVAGLPADAERLRVARELGFLAVDEMPDAQSADVVVEASGSAGGIGACLGVVRKGGRFVLIGIAGRPVEVLLDQLLLKELAVSTGFGSTPRSWRQALQLVERGDIRLEPLVSEVAPLGEWQRVFAELRSGRKMKVVLDPSGSPHGTDEKSLLG